MTFNHVDIGCNPSFDEIEDFIKSYIEDKTMQITPREVFDYWEKKCWKTKKGTYVKTLEIAINVSNGVFVSKQKMEKQIQIRDAKMKARVVAYNSNQATPYYGYYDQLKDDRWKMFRWFILKVRGSKCEVCGSENNLQVHHTIYNKKRKAWEYTCNEVIVVCDGCHRKLHGII